MPVKIVSEGVKTTEQFKVISGLGIDYIQGYYFSRPLDADAFIDFLKDKNILMVLFFSFLNSPIIHCSLQT